MTKAIKTFITTFLNQFRIPSPNPTFILMVGYKRLRICGKGIKQ